MPRADYAVEDVGVMEVASPFKRFELYLFVLGVVCEASVRSVLRHIVVNLNTRI